MTTTLQRYTKRPVTIAVAVRGADALTVTPTLERTNR